MADPSYANTIVVLQGHLEEIYEALDAAYGYHVASDLAAQYKNIGGTTRASNLQKRLEHAVGRVGAYLQEEEDGPTDGS